MATTPWVLALAKPFLVPLPRAAPHYCCQTGRRSSRTRRVSASAGESISALCWISPRRLTQIPWIRSSNSSYEFPSQNPLPSRKSRKRSTRQSPAEHRERMASLLRSTRQRATMPLWPSTMTCLLSGRRIWCQTTSARPWSSPSIRKLEVNRTVGTTGVFPSSQLQERSLRESSLTDSSQSLNRPSLRHSAASGLAEAQ